MKKLNRLMDTLFAHDDFGKAIFRISFGVLFLMYGIDKIVNGTAFIQALFINKGIPGFLAYSVYLGEVIAPICVIVGLYTRLSAIFWIGTTLVIIWLLHMHDLLALNRFGGWAAENVGVYLFAGIAILFLGAGKYSLDARSKQSHL